MKNYRFLVLITFLALVALIIYPLGVLPARNFVNRLISPISKDVSTFVIGSKNFFYNISQINSLTKTNQELRDENLQLSSQTSQCLEIAHQNQILSEELGFAKNDTSKELIPAYITGQSPSSFMQVFKINKGSLDGVTVGKPVVSQGYLIGVISEVSDHDSQVNLITNSNSLIPVMLADSRGTGLLKGGLEGLSIKEIPVDTDVKIGEQVLTSGLGGDLPQDISIGKVSKIVSKESEIFHEATVDSPIKFGKLEVVFVYK